LSFLKFLLKQEQREITVSFLNTWLLILYISSSSTSVSTERFNTREECVMVAEKIGAEVQSAQIIAQCIQLPRKPIKRLKPMGKEFSATYN
jgi:hypothetical protein